VQITKTNHYTSHVSHPTYYLLPNGKVGLRNYQNEPMMNWGPLEEAVELYSKPEMGEEYRPVAAWARCHLAARKGTSVQTHTGAGSSQGKINVGNASEVAGRKEGGKSAWNPNNSHSGQSLSQQESDTSARGSNSSPKSRYVSKDATHCVEIVPKGFKCDGPYDRFMTNICATRISIWWKLGSDPWGYQVLDSKACTPVSAFKDNRNIDYKACSWDSSASHGPLSNPCRYE
jgi:hypothetical protein